MPESRYDEVSRIVRELKDGAPLIVTTDPAALAMATSRAVMELREQVKRLEATNQDLYRRLHELEGRDG